MSTLNNKKLILIIRYAPVAIVVVFSLAVNMFAFQDNREKATHSIDSLQEELLSQRQEVIRSQVHEVYKKLIVEKSDIQPRLERDSKQRVYEAYSIAHHIYAKNPTKSKAEIIELISESLRPIRFFNGRGYYFIVDQFGTNVMHGAQPQLEGTSIWNNIDSDGNYYTRDLINITASKGEGFHEWRFQKPGSPLNTDWQKVGFVKLFEPYNLTIGTGEYLSDVTSDVKQELLNWFKEYSYGEDGYFFVVDKETGTLLSLHHNDFMGLDLQVGKPIDSSLHQQMLEQVKNGGGFIRFERPLTLSGNVLLEQVNFVREVNDWGWIIGTGFSTQGFEKYLRLKESQLEEYNRSSITRLVVLTFISTVLLTLTSLYVSNLIARRFEMFQARITKDFNELNETKNQMEYMALHDALTGLPNRIYLLREINRAIAYAKGVNGKLAIMFVDLNNFKNVNDLYGHAVGDQLLEVVSRKFETIIGSRDLVSRFGGDEFVFCFPCVKSATEAYEIAERIQQVIAEPIVLDGRILNASCSIGVAMYPDDSDDAEMLISKADTVLYRVKATEKGGVLFYDDSVSDQIKHRMTVETELLQAIQRQEIYVLYQPQIDLQSCQMFGVEALARWESKSLGHVSPEIFVSVAEETGLIRTLGFHVFRKACEGVYQMFPNGKNAIKLSINMSPIQIFDPTLSESLLQICHEVGMDPSRITIEITENIPISDLANFIPYLEKLREVGFGLSLDDFGTGYSSLSYINNLPLTEIKIDRAFVNQFLENKQTEMLVRMILSIGKSCGSRVVSEGVETQEEVDKLKSLGCDLAQGYFFDAPVTIDEIAIKYGDASELGAYGTQDK